MDLPFFVLCFGCELDDFLVDIVGAVHGEVVPVDLIKVAAPAVFANKLQLAISPNRIFVQSGRHAHYPRVSAAL